ncbi:hypothetical protein SAMN05216525_125117 [Bradyrhizobium sp. Gha]|nr:hypothetical protein SAMN05216525_125117 [Bradyrhizobium sp. Gha]
MGSKYRLQHTLLYNYVLKSQLVSNVQWPCHRRVTPKCLRGTSNELERPGIGGNEPGSY